MELTTTGEVVKSCKSLSRYMILAKSNRFSLSGTMSHVPHCKYSGIQESCNAAIA